MRGGSFAPPPLKLPPELALANIGEQIKRLASAGLFHCLHYQSVGRDKLAFPAHPSPATLSLMRAYSKQN